MTEPAEPSLHDVAALSGFAAKAKPVRIVSAGAPALHTLSFGFNPDDATETQGM